MGASRENQSIWIDFKYRRWKSLFTKIFVIIVPGSINIPRFTSAKTNRPVSKFFWIRCDRHLVIKDSFVIPYNKIIGCKIFGHRWSSREEEVKYDLDSKYCWKCSKYSTVSDVRNDLIGKILK